MNKDSLEKAKEISKVIDKMDLPPVVKQQAILGVAMDVKPDAIIKGMMGTINKIETDKAERNNPKQKVKVDYTETEKMIVDMLTENTGTNMLDSGGAYGRRWQMNRQIIDFRKAEACQVEIHVPRKKGKRYKYDREGEILIYYDIFHYLTNFLELDDVAKMLNREFERFAELPENKREGWLCLMEKFAEKIAPSLGFTFGGIFNTYNYESILSQVLQGTWLYKDGDEYDSYWMLQIHGGCDVRGGYTKPVIFRVIDRDYTIMAQNEVRVSCECGYCNAHSDDGGYHWYSDGCYRNNRVTDDTRQADLNGDIVEEKDIPFAERLEWEETGEYGKDIVRCSKCKKPLDFGVMEDF